jgi:hypothetical protein
VDPAAEFDRQFAAARKRLGPGKVFTYTGPGPRKGKKFTTDRADDRAPAENAASKKGFLDRLGEGVKKATARTGKPSKRMFMRSGNKLLPNEKRKYEAALKQWEKAQEASSKKKEKGGFRKATAADIGSGSAAPRLPDKKSAGGRVMMKKAAKKKAAKKKAAKKKAARRP